MQILNNITELWGDDLKRTLKPGTKLKIAASCFSIYAYEALKAELENIADLEVFFVDRNALAACFVKNGRITEYFCKELAKREPLRVVFRDSGFSDDSVKINVEQIFKLMSPHTDVMTL